MWDLNLELYQGAEGSNKTGGLREATCRPMRRQNQQRPSGDPHGGGQISPRESMAPFVLATLAAVALFTVFSPSAREWRDAPTVYARDSMTPGPIPVTDRRPTRSG